MRLKGSPKAKLNEEARDFINLYASLGERAENFLPEHVMETLVEVCDHSMTQAEQCATITHYKGKCEVRTGSLKEMTEMRYQLISNGLKASVEN